MRSESPSEIFRSNLQRVMSFVHRHAEIKAWSEHTDEGGACELAFKTAKIDPIRSPSRSEVLLQPRETGQCHEPSLQGLESLGFEVWDFKGEAQD